MAYNLPAYIAKEYAYIIQSHNSVRMLQLIDYNMVHAEKPREQKQLKYMYTCMLACMHAGSSDSRPRPTKCLYLKQDLQLMQPVYHSTKVHMIFCIRTLHLKMAWYSGSGDFRLRGHDLRPKGHQDGADLNGFQAVHNSILHLATYSVVRTIYTNLLSTSRNEIVLVLAEG